MTQLVNVLEPVEMSLFYKFASSLTQKGSFFRFLESERQLLSHLLTEKELKQQIRLEKINTYSGRRWGVGLYLAIN